MDFSPLFIKICQQGLAAGLFNQKELVNFVKHQYGFGCIGCMLEHVTIAAIVPDKGKRDRELYSRLESLVATSPRGAFVIVEKQFDSNDCTAKKSTFQTIISDGSGHLAAGGKFNFYDAIPSTTTILESMLAFEVFECRKLCEKIKEHRDSQHAIRKFDLDIGKVFTNVSLPGEAKPYAKVAIAWVDFKNGTLRLLLTKRGSKTKYSMTLMASRFVAYAELESASIPNAQVSSDSGTGDIFAQRWLS